MAHADMKGCVRVCATLRRGAAHSSLTKMKLDAVSSTETEIVLAGEKLPEILWFRSFQIAQGGNDDEDTLSQDDKSAILSENDGRHSAGQKGSRHVDMRRFFATDWIKKKHMKAKHCPSEEMIADFFTKPLQGLMFHQFRDSILGVDNTELKDCKHDHVTTLAKFDLVDSSASTESQECVECDTNQKCASQHDVGSASHKSVTGHKHTENGNRNAATQDIMESDKKLINWKDD